MSCCLTHAAPPAAGAEASAFAAEGDEVLKVTGLTLSPQEPMGQDPTAEILFELFYDEVWEGASCILLDLFFERKPVVLDEPIEGRLFRLVSGVGELIFCKICVGHTGGGLLCKPAATIACLLDGA